MRAKTYSYVDEDTKSPTSVAMSDSDSSESPKRPSGPNAEITIADVSFGATAFLVDLRRGEGDSFAFPNAACAFSMTVPVRVLYCFREVTQGFCFLRHASHVGSSGSPRKQRSLPVLQASQAAMSHHWP